MMQKQLLETIEWINENKDTEEFEEADEILDGKLTELVRIWKD